MGEEHVTHIARLYTEWKVEEGCSAIISMAETARNDFNLSPSRYVAQNGQEQVLPLEEAVVIFREAEEERAIIDQSLEQILRILGLSQ
jgi:type I restriction enzyme M protein